MTLATLAFLCVTQMPTTSFFARTVGDEVVVRLLHHNGVAFMPIHEGIVVPNDLEILKRRSDVMSKLGADLEFRFPIKNCMKHGPGLMSCRSGDKKKINGISVEALSLSTSKATSQFMEYTFEHRDVMLSLNVEGLDISPYVTMRYSPGECEFEF